MRWSLALVLLFLLPGPALARDPGALLFSPRGVEEGPGYCLEVYRLRPKGNLEGGALWFAGSVAPVPDVDAPIPHWDFHTRKYASRWGLLYLRGYDNGQAAVIGGIGPAVVEREFLDVSNVTGVTYDGGRKSRLEVQAQIGLLLHVGRRFAVRFGHDSQFGTFYGLAGLF